MRLFSTARARWVLAAGLFLLSVILGLGGTVASWGDHDSTALLVAAVLASLVPFACGCAAGAWLCWTGRAMTQDRLGHACVVLFVGAIGAVAAAAFCLAVFDLGFPDHALKSALGFDCLALRPVCAAVGGLGLALFMAAATMGIAFFGFLPFIAAAISMAFIRPSRPPGRTHVVLGGLGCSTGGLLAILGGLGMSLAV